jgi:hypothetical protein
MQEKQIIVISSVTEDNSTTNIIYKIITYNLLEHLNDSNQSGKKETMNLVKKIVEAVKMYEHEMSKEQGKI